MPVPESIPLRLRRAYLALHRQTTLFLESTGITADQFVCLLFLEQTVPVSQTELARLTDSDKNTISAILNRLEKKNLIFRTVFEQDQRIRQVWLTEKGESIRETLISDVLPVNDRLKNTLTPGDTFLLLSLLKKVTDSLTTLPPPEP